MAQYAVFRLNGDLHREGRIGDVELDEQNRLGVVAAEPTARADLDKAVEDLNGRQALIIKLPPAPGGSRFGIRKKEIPRSDPGFFDAVQDNLRRWHSMELVAE